MSKSNGRGFVHESPNENKEWYTPRWIFDGIPLEFDLDPCSPDPRDPTKTKHLTPCKKHLCFADDGLRTPWDAGATVFLNPPYGADIPAWLGKLVTHGNGIVLVYARTANKWFHDCIADALFFIQGRVKFINAETGTTMVRDPKTGELKNSSPGADSVLLAYGPKCVAALEACSLLGSLYYPQPLPTERPQQALFAVKS